MCGRKDNQHSDAILPRNIVAPRNLVGGSQRSKCLGETGFFNAELIHARAERVGMKIQPSGGTLLPFNDPVYLLEDMENMRTLDFFHGPLTM